MMYAYRAYELVYLCAFDDLAHRERGARSGRPRVASRQARHGGPGPLVERVVNKIWKPTAFSAAP